jgi:hypothetical protein
MPCSTVSSLPKRLKNVASNDTLDRIAANAIGFRTYRVLVQRHGHLLYLVLPRPTKGVHVRLNYGGAGIRRVNALDYFGSAQQTRIDQNRTL